MFRVIIAGTRSFNDRALLYQRCDEILTPYANVGIEIVSGCNKGTKGKDGTWLLGADALGQQYAIERGYAIEPFPAMWAIHGLAAGPIRNREMGHYAYESPDGGGLIAFWDGVSRGTADMIKYADSLHLPIWEIHYKQQL